MESHLRTELVLQALNMALYLRRPQGVIHHSDQGIQYTAYAFGKRCSEWGVRPSMGSVGDCYDNALCESFFASLECELLDRRSFQNHAEARMAVFHYIEGWYNTHRRHSSIGYYAPIAFERRYTSSIQHAEPFTVHQIGATPPCHKGDLSFCRCRLRCRHPSKRRPQNPQCFLGAQVTLVTDGQPQSNYHVEMKNWANALGARPRNTVGGRFGV